MLVQPIFNEGSPDYIKVATGIYIGNINFHLSVKRDTLGKQPLAPMALSGRQEPTLLFGVSDNISQVVIKYQNMLDHPGYGWAICFSPVFRDHQPPKDGWRWHKWGDYIGNQKIQHEYLYDEQGIDYVLVYQIYQVLSVDISLPPIDVAGAYPHILRMENSI